MNKSSVLKYKKYNNVSNFMIEDNNSIDLHNININFITLGNDCSPASALKSLNIRPFALPFDWVVSNVQSLKKCLDDDFLHYHTNLKFNAIRTKLVDEYGFEFPHDYPHAENNNIHQDDVNIEETAYIKDDWINYYDIVYDKYKRRIDRFNNIVSDNKSIIVLCRYYIKDVYTLYNILTNKYKRQFYIICATPEIKNYELKNNNILLCNPEQGGNWNESIVWSNAIKFMVSRGL